MGRTFTNLGRHRPPPQFPPQATPSRSMHPRGYGSMKVEDDRDALSEASVAASPPRSHRAATGRNRPRVILSRPYRAPSAPRGAPPPSLRSTATARKHLRSKGWRRRTGIEPSSPRAKIGPWSLGGVLAPCGRGERRMLGR
jgi:hypothetical protein